MKHHTVSTGSLAMTTATVSLLSFGFFGAPIYAEQSAPEGVAVRACSAVSSANKPSKEPNKRKRGNADNSTAEAPGCLEVRSSALDILEFLQSFVRDERWILTDEHNAEDSWTISRSLDIDELLAHTKTYTNPVRVNWTGGKAFLRATTLEREGGFHRVQISVIFEGYGQSSDPIATPRKSWPLDSNGSLETRLTSGLETHFKSIR